ncbi:hypothetical protein IGI39_002930 [Enterococcus sp. AZ135]
MRKGENIYYRKDGRWEGRFPKGRQKNGRIKYGYVYGKSYSEVKQKLYPLRIHYQSVQQIQGVAAFSFEEWAGEWLNEVQDEVKPSTFSSYNYKLRRYVLPLLKDTSLNELSKEIGRKLLIEMQKRLSRSTVQVIFRILNKCLNSAKKRGKINVNPFSELKIPKAKQKKVRALSLSEQKKIMKIATNEKNGYGLPSLLALYSGMRIGEIAALKWSDIDFSANLIYVHHTYQRIPTISGQDKTQLILTDSKTEASVRIIPISQTLKKILRNHRKRSKGIFVFSTQGQPCELDYLLIIFIEYVEKRTLCMCIFINCGIHSLRVV